MGHVDGEGVVWGVWGEGGDSERNKKKNGRTIVNNKFLKRLHVPAMGEFGILIKNN
jgi:hypothetical protein